MFTMLTSITLAGAALFVGLNIPSVNAHGYVQDVVIGTTHYTGYLPYTDPYYNPVPERIIRAIPGNGTYANRCFIPSLPWNVRCD